jgi:hydroxymethylpyrimidine pyrophosphatase-like HAD family hydrolase
MGFSKDFASGIEGSFGEAQKPLDELKTLGVHLIGTDFDGTVAGAGITTHRTGTLLGEVLQAGVGVALITARDGSLRRDFLAELLEAIDEVGGGNAPFFIGTGNGSGLHRVVGTTLDTVYANTLTISEISQLAAAVTQSGGVRGEVGRRWVAERLAEDWDGFVPNHLLDISKRHSIWVESTKMTVPLPEDPKEREDSVAALQQAIGTDFAVSWVGAPLGVITKRLPEDPKLYALRHAASLLGEADFGRTASFGDTPTGNDRGLLSIRYSFTNDATYYEGAPPYRLENSSDLGDSIAAAVTRVHEAIHYLID